jgi:hypothetical protein
MGGLVASAVAAKRSDAATVIDMSTYQPANTFAHLAYGQTGNGAYWKTSFAFVNYGTDAGSVQLLTWTPSGSPLAVSVVGGATASQQTFAVPAGGSVVVGLDETVPNLITGWAGLIITGLITGQGIFRARVPGRPDYEAAVPLLARTQTASIIPLPVTSTPVLGMPFDNTGGYVTSVAFANTAAADRTLDLVFVDNSGATLFTAHEPLPAHNQMAFETSSRYPAVANKQGWMRILNNAADFTALGFRFNPSGAFTTWLPVLA